MIPIIKTNNKVNKNMAFQVSPNVLVKEKVFNKCYSIRTTTINKQVRNQFSQYHQEVTTISSEKELVETFKNLTQILLNTFLVLQVSCNTHQV